MYILIFMLGAWIGLIVGYFIRLWLGTRSAYDGVILVTREDHKTLYSLVLEDYPDEIIFKKEVVFKVDASTLEEIDDRT